MKLHLASDEAGARLSERFVENHAQFCSYHRRGWKQVIENNFDWPVPYLMPEEAGSIRGVLPPVWQEQAVRQLSDVMAISKLAENKATKHALTVSSGEPAVLAKARIQILQDPERQGRLALAGIDWVREKFDVGGTATKILELHSALCGIT